jgi:hypothetical protein
MTPTTNTRLLRLLLLPQIHMRNTVKPLHPIPTLSKATRTKIPTANRDILQRTPMPSRATHRLILTTSRPLCCPSTMRESHPGH